MPQQIGVGDLPEEQRYQTVAEPLRQVLLLKRIAYRAATATLERVGHRLVTD